MVAQLNLILEDRSWWSLDRRADAERHGFSPEVIGAFFDGIEIGKVDTVDLREREIPLPSRDDGYARVLLAGTTGAGKTTLLRHAIGSNHNKDRFPSTSTAKTTIAETEIITSNGPYKSAVTFMSEFEVRAHIDECLEAASLAFLDDQSNEKIAEALLTHREQRFRLSYVLGELFAEESSDQDDFSFDEIKAEPEVEEAVSDDDRRTNVHTIQEYLTRIKTVATAVKDKISIDFEPYDAQHSADDKAAWLELFSDGLFDDDGFAQLAIDIKDDVEKRFDLLPQDELRRAQSGWPTLWTCQTPDRKEFLGKVRRFSSNHSAHFGKLLTPLVDGIRVRGPFKPLHSDLQTADRLVWLDGQGLGHTAESVSSVSTKVTKRFGEVDIILLIDSAQQPMQAAPLALLRTAASAGYADKIAIAFSHFDQVKGDNLRTLQQKRNHVLASITNAVASLRQLLGTPVTTALERRIEHQVFMLGGLDREIGNIPSGVVSEFGKLLSLLQEAASPVVPVKAAPVYNVGGLELALRDAVESFLRPWEARLGLAFRDGIRTEHWTRIKALSRRFANNWGDEYDNLRPASDLIGRLQEEISRWLDTPAGWTSPPADDAERISALNPVRGSVFSALHDLAQLRLADSRRSDWQFAYNYSGYGSGGKRAGDIRKIYETSAPPISSSMRPQAREFLTEVINIVRNAVEKAGGTFDLPTTA